MTDQNSPPKENKANHSTQSGFEKLKQQFLNLEPMVQRAVVIGAVALLLGFCSLGGQSPQEQAQSLMDKLRPVACEHHQLWEKYQQLAQENPMMELQKDLAYGGSLAALQHVNIDTEEVTELVERQQEVKQLQKRYNDEIKTLMGRLKNELDKDELEKLRKELSAIHAKPCG